MELVSMATAALAKAIGSRVGAELGGSLVKGAKVRILGDPEQKALQRALQRAFSQVQDEFGDRLAAFDVNDGFWVHEGAAELALVLVPGGRPSAVRLAERVVDSLGGSLSEDDRFDRVTLLRPVFTTLLASLADQVRGEAALQAVLGRSDAARTAAATEAMAQVLGAGQADGDDVSGYLHWTLDQHRYLRTAGVVRNTAVRLPLTEVFIGLSALPDRFPGDRARVWFEREREKLTALVEAGQLDRTGFEAALDRLLAQLGQKLPVDAAAQPTLAAPVLKTVRDSAHVLVLGDPGTGKTTLLRYLAFTHARAMLDGVPLEGRAALFPVYVRISEYARHGFPHKGLGEFLASDAGRLECPVARLPDLLRQQLEAGRCLILLDGLDEVASAQLRRDVVGAVVNFVTAHTRAGNRFVVTSRIAGYQAAPLPQPFAAVRLQDMDDDTITRFLEVYCREVERAEAPLQSAAAVVAGGMREAAAIGQAFEANAGVRRLAVNPLLLTALVLIHRASGRLPHRRVEAYIEVCNALGRTWRSAQGVAEADLPDERILTRWLTELGWWMHHHRPEGAVTNLELLEVLGPLWALHQGCHWDSRILQAADPMDTAAGQAVIDFVKKADTHTGLLVERAPGRYGFAHLTFEEYYAGRALAFRGSTEQRVTAIRQRLHDPRYHEPILLAVGLIGTDYAEQIDSVVAEAIYPACGSPSPYEDLLGRDFLFMLRVLADDTPLAATTIDMVVNQAVEEWLTPTSRCRFTNYREALTRHLAALHGTRAGDRLAAAVGNQAIALTNATRQHWIQLAAITAKNSQLPEGAVKALVAVATSTDTDPEVRVEAGAVLASGGVLNPAAVDALVHIATSTDTDPGVRTDAASALSSGAALNTPVIDALVHIATSTDTDPGVRT
ncbi:NACHT domain-containing protein, partial [Micromonospora zhanjiangensis]